ncbi:nucleotidyltransferase family protein [Thermodesulfobacteriota bacterium]
MRRNEMTRCVDENPTYSATQRELLPKNNWCTYPSDVQAELLVILGCLRDHFSDNDGKEPAKVPEQEISWDAVLSLARNHRVIPFLQARAEHLAAHECPARFLRALDEGSKNTIYFNAIMAGELARLSNLFQANDIPVIAIKGCAQTRLLYKNLRMRGAGDIDLVTSSETVEKVHELILKAGYVWEWRYPQYSWTRAVTRSLTNELRYRHKATGILVELHWRFFLLRTLLPIEFDTILADSQTIEISQRHVKTLSDEHMILLMLSHGALHSWSGLFWLCDVAQTFRGLGGLDWSGILDEASRLGVYRSVTSGLIVSHLLLGSPLPHEVRLSAERDKTLPHLLSYVVRTLLAFHTGKKTFSGSLSEVRYKVRLGQALAYKMEVLLVSPHTRGLLGRCWDRLMRTPLRLLTR